MSNTYKRLKKEELLQKCQQARIQHSSKIKRNDLIQLLIENDLQINNQQLELEDPLIQENKQENKQEESILSAIS